MSNERRHHDDLSDPLVSRTYRDLSKERAPEHLDHIVLNEARKAARPGYIRNISWLRPAAWVTTIGLCLAIVLEVSDVAPPAQSLPDAPAEVVKESEESITAMPATGGTAAPAAVETDSFDQDDRQLLRNAEKRARLQTGSDQESVESLLQVAPALGAASDAALDRYCEESETEDPNDWLACILELERQGLLEAARAERDLLRESFPDVPLLISR